MMNLMSVTAVSVNSRQVDVKLMEFITKPAATIIFDTPPPERVRIIYNESIEIYYYKLTTHWQHPVVERTQHSHLKRSAFF